MASLWQFGNDYDGLLIVVADSKEEAIQKREQWKAEQIQADKNYRAWWTKAQSKKAGLWRMNSATGWIPGGFEKAKEIYGPVPDSGVTYIFKAIEGDPEDIGYAHSYMWSE